MFFSFFFHQYIAWAPRKNKHALPLDIPLIIFLNSYTGQEARMEDFFCIVTPLFAKTSRGVMKLYQFRCTLKKEGRHFGGQNSRREVVSSTLHRGSLYELLPTYFPLLTGRTTGKRKLTQFQNYGMFFIFETMGYFSVLNYGIFFGFKLRDTFPL